jgi:hypothetical protein
MSVPDGGYSRKASCTPCFYYVMHRVHIAMRGIRTHKCNGYMYWLHRYLYIQLPYDARDSHIKPDSEAGGLIWVEGWYQRRYGKFHVIIFLSHILHWPFPSIDFYIAKKIFCSTCKYFCFESGVVSKIICAKKDDA